MSSRGYVCFDRFFVEVEVVSTPDEMTLGLMGRESLASDEGMLFKFDNDSIHKIWMKNMKISLDILWIDKNGVIISIVKDARPCDDNVCFVLGPGLSSRYVLEVAGGYTDRNGISVGDQVMMKLY